MYCCTYICTYIIYPDAIVYLLPFFHFFLLLRLTMKLYRGFLLLPLPIYKTGNFSARTCVNPTSSTTNLQDFPKASSLAWACHYVCFMLLTMSRFYTRDIKPREMVLSRAFSKDELCYGTQSNLPILISVAIRVEALSMCERIPLMSNVTFVLRTLH